MKKKIIALISMSVFFVSVLSGCSAGQVLKSDSLFSTAKEDVEGGEEIAETNDDINIASADSSSDNNDDAIDFSIMFGNEETEISAVDSESSVQDETGQEKSETEINDSMVEFAKDIMSSQQDIIEEAIIEDEENETESGAYVAEESETEQQEADVDIETETAETGEDNIEAGNAEDKASPSSYLSASKFYSMMENKGYSMMDMSDLAFGDYASIIGDYVMAFSYDTKNSEQICIAFCDLNSEDYAKTFYNELLSSITSEYEIDQYGYIGDDPCGYFTESGIDMFYLFSIKDNTIMYATATVDNKEVVKTLFSEFGY